MVLDNIARLGIDDLIVIGGDHTLSFAHVLNQKGIRVIGIPKTMDNDVRGTEYCIGFSTAITRAKELITRQRTTLGSHERIGVFRIFGRDAGLGAERPCAGSIAPARIAARLPVPVDVAARVLARSGDPELFALLDGFIADCDVADLEQRFASAFVSNPRSGEFVKGHAIVLAELGLCPYRGKVVRDPNMFEGPGRKARRAEHLIARLAFTRVLWSGIGEEP